MNRLLTYVALSAASATGAVAGGIDRSGQPVGIIFKDGNYAEVGVSHTSPDVGGSDIAQMPPGFPFPYDSGASYGDVADAFTSYSFGIKYDVNERFSLALIGGEDFGSDITYRDKPGSLLGGTSAIADTYSLTLMGRYKFDDNWSVHAGLRADRADGEIGLGGLAYGGPTIFSPAGVPFSAAEIQALTGGARSSNAVSGYNVDLGDDIAYGYAIGAAYEIPEIALRVALTYYSAIKHEFPTKESFATDTNGDGIPDTNVRFNSDDTEVETPQAVNLDFQSGIAEDTLLFGSIRWAEWSEFEIAPEQFQNATGVGLVSLEDSYTYTLGVARRFTERFAASASVIYEPEQTDDLVSPLAPTNGFTAVALGGSYRIDNIELSAGIRYTWLGDAKPETGTPDVARADFTNNEAVSVGVRLGYYF